MCRATLQSLGSDSHGGKTGLILWEWLCQFWYPCPSVGEPGCCCLNTWQIRLPPEYRCNPSSFTDGPMEAGWEVWGWKELWRMGTARMLTIWVWLTRIHSYRRQKKMRSNENFNKVHRDFNKHFRGVALKDMQQVLMQQVDKITQLN